MMSNKQKSAQSADEQTGPHHVRRARAASLAVDLVETLQSRIKDGTYAPGMRMPTEAEIMAEHGVNRTVVRKPFPLAAGASGGYPARYWQLCQ